ncbi:MAG: hypothetical protein GWN89_12540, partial [Thermoplasmata archaeon]|nr:hypothetical protein [Thermoplasmata archaeon]NIT78130.1 hypothetical protein [Thermoplasmata archaeon]NIY04500.1 hypothetical protein [Thermoplasmata archaeon]
DGKLYVAGYTRSADFPMKPDHYDDSHNGHEDIFIAKLSADLTTLHNS